MNKNLDRMSLRDTTREENSKLLRNPKTIDPLLTEIYAKGQLVSNRIPFAKIGFDPDKVNIYQATDDEQFNIAGVFSKATDRMFMVSSSASTIVHEAIHRGIEIVGKNVPGFNKEFNKLKTSAKHDPEELLVRYLMFKYAGNPEEAEEAGDLGTDQIKIAKQDFGNKENIKILENLTKMAQEYIKTQKPGGPR